MEMQVLRLIDQQGHNNIIDLVACYSWRGELNFVFPFVELNLHHVLHTNWKPESMAAPALFPKHWLWQQMILVADALQTIHNPPNQLRPDLGMIVGFHFDLKPKNILVTSDGILKITDFGQSMVKLVAENEPAYATYIGGDLAYCPPEVAPTKIEIKELRAAVTSSSLGPSLHVSDPSTPPSTASSRETSSAASLVGSRDRRRESSTTQSANGCLQRVSSATSYSAPSSISSQTPHVTATANYDVWSLACIMMEVLVFIFEKEQDAVEKFEHHRKEEGNEFSFHIHNGTLDRNCLKGCVKSMLDNFRNRDDPDATITPGQPRSYLSDVVGLLERMFVADPAQRLSSRRVVEELIKIEANHQEDNDPNADVLRFMRNLGPVAHFKELGYSRSDGIVPFYNM